MPGWHQRQSRPGLWSGKAADRNVTPWPLDPSEFGRAPPERVVEVTDQLKPYAQQVIAASNLAPLHPQNLVRLNRHGGRLEEDAEKSVAAR